MKSAKRSPNWALLLFWVFDKSKAYCVADLVEEFEEVRKCKGKWQAIRWLFRQITISSPYLFPGVVKNYVGWVKDCVASITSSSLLSFNKGGAVESRILTSIRWQPALFAFALLLLITIVYSYNHTKSQLLAEQIKELNVKNSPADLSVATIVIEPKALLRSAGDAITRAVISPSKKVVCLHLVLPTHEVETKTYRLIIKRIDEDKMFTVDGLKKLDDGTLSVLLPTALLLKGDFFLTVVDESDGSALQDYYLRVASTDDF